MYWLDISNIKVNYENTLRIFKKNEDISKWISLLSIKKIVVSIMFCYKAIIETKTIFISLHHS